MSSLLYRAVKKDFTKCEHCFILTLVGYAPLAQLDRVAHYECEGSGFESLWAHQVETDVSAFFIFLLFESNEPDGMKTATINNYLIM